MGTKLLLFLLIIISTLPPLNCHNGQVKPEVIAFGVDLAVYELTILEVNRQVNLFPEAKTAWSIVADSIDDVVLPILKAERIQTEKLFKWINELSTLGLQDRSVWIISKLIDLGFSFIPRDQVQLFWNKNIYTEYTQIILISAFGAIKEGVRYVLEVK